MVLCACRAFRSLEPLPTDPANYDETFCGFFLASVRQLARRPCCPAENPSQNLALKLTNCCALDGVCRHTREEELKLAKSSLAPSHSCKVSRTASSMTRRCGQTVVRMVEAMVASKASRRLHPPSKNCLFATHMSVLQCSLPPCMSQGCKTRVFFVFGATRIATHENRWATSWPHGASTHEDLRAPPPEKTEKMNELRLVRDVLQPGHNRAKTSGKH